MGRHRAERPEKVRDFGSDDSGGEDFGAMLAAFEAQQSEKAQRKDPAVGEKVRGTVLSVGEEVAFVDVGAKAEGMLRLAEVRGWDESGPELEVGDVVEALISAIDPESGCFVLRLRAGGSPAAGSAANAELSQAHTYGLPVEGVVSAINKGGVEVKVSGVRCFCPISQLDVRFVADPSVYLERRLTFRVTRYEEGSDRRGANVVLSRRAHLEAEAKARAEETRRHLAVGAVLPGTVTSVTSYGAFVDLGGLEGLLHVSEIAHERIEDPRQVLREGQELQVKVLAIEAGKKSGDNERISLSLKALAKDPWTTAAARFPVGSEVNGKVVRLEQFGAFVELAPGIDGLLHISQLDEEERRARHARELVQVGETLPVRVLDVDLARRRISLTRGTQPRDGAAEAEAEARREAADAPGFGALGDFFKKAEKRR